MLPILNVNIRLFEPFKRNNSIKRMRDFYLGRLVGCRFSSYHGFEIDTTFCIGVRFCRIGRVRNENGDTVKFRCTNQMPKLVGYTENIVYYVRCLASCTRCYSTYLVHSRSKQASLN